MGLLLTVLMGMFFGYVSRVYKASPEALASLNSSQYVRVENHEEYISFIPKESTKKTGLVFYQGGKVEEEAYATLMHRLAENGVSSFLVHMPFNLAVFNSQIAGKVIDQETTISNWYIAGHSLGGAMASSYAEKNATTLKRLILLAAYPSKDLRHTDLITLSIYGSNDQVLNYKQYEKNLQYLPHVEELVLLGGNHAQFGDYEVQTGDGKPTLSASDQLDKTIKAIVNFINKNSQ